MRNEAQAELVEVLCERKPTQERFCNHNSFPLESRKLSRGSSEPWKSSLIASERGERLFRDSRHPRVREIKKKKKKKKTNQNYYSPSLASHTGRVLNSPSEALKPVVVIKRKEVGEWVEKVFFLRRHRRRRRRRAFSNSLLLSLSLFLSLIHLPADGVATCTGACTPAATHPPFAAGQDLCQLWMWPVRTRSTEFSKKMGSSARVRLAAFSNSPDWAKSE